MASGRTPADPAHRSVTREGVSAMEWRTKYWNFKILLTWIDGELNLWCRLSLSGPGDRGKGPGAIIRTVLASLCKEDDSRCTVQYFEFLSLSRCTAGEVIGNCLGVTSTRYSRLCPKEGWEGRTSFDCCLSCRSECRRYVMFKSSPCVMARGQLATGAPYPVHRHAERLVRHVGFHLTGIGQQYHSYTTLRLSHT